MSFPAPRSYSAVVGDLERRGFRPREVPATPGWEQWPQARAWCPICRTDAALVIEPYGRDDPRAVLWCSNDQCATATETREQPAHERLWAALHPPKGTPTP